MNPFTRNLLISTLFASSSVFAEIRSEISCHAPTSQLPYMPTELIVTLLPESGSASFKILDDTGITLESGTSKLVSSDLSRSDVLNIQSSLQFESDPNGDLSTIVALGIGLVDPACYPFPKRSCGAYPPLWVKRENKLMMQLAKIKSEADETPQLWKLLDFNVNGAKKFARGPAMNFVNITCQWND